MLTRRILHELGRPIRVCKTVYGVFWLLGAVIRHRDKFAANTPKPLSGDWERVGSKRPGWAASAKGVFQTLSVLCGRPGGSRGWFWRKEREVK